MQEQFGRIRVACVMAFIGLVVYTGCSLLSAAVAIVEGVKQ